ncbi:MULTISPECIES: DUF3185 family protein [unclassified Guyparkeria]|uniref:DUF3185 family protein n=1 Tax=unclassified Guyparkeria TaxID=2626246 RepID=UPI000733545C|nr:MULTISPECIES: DUF3185 family protein [unclassified Guyparkeria]KTG16269.1 hypothetical protein AUR63_05435 [Guyparkeria sp. XI15]OAE85120.1 hypothetical protein AWR35_05445 [Guyparkeria sp. WRN-7]
MKGQQLIGVALLVLGLILLYFGYESSQGLDDQVSEALTGEYTEGTMFYWIAGGVSAVVGLVMLVARKK